MKTIITLLICAAGITAFGQQGIVIDTAIAWKTLHDEAAAHHGTFLLRGEDNMPTYPNAIQFLPFFEQKIHSDTLEITDTAIHFIKIGGKVFEIKRSVELQEVHRSGLWITPYGGMQPLGSERFIVPAINNK